MNKEIKLFEEMVAEIFTKIKKLFYLKNIEKSIVQAVEKEV